MMKILNSFSLKPEQRQTLEAAGHTVIDADKLDDATAQQIDVVYGWNAAATRVNFDRLQFVQAMSAGVDYLPLAELAKHHVLLANTSGIHAEPIAEYVLGVLFTISRGILPAIRADRDMWTLRQERPPMTLLKGKTAVIFGTGHIGSTIATKLQALGLHTIGVSAHGRPAAGFDQVMTDVATHEAAGRADVVINALPLTPDTKHFYDEAFFAAASKRPLFINIGRGPSVDMAALTQALKNKQISAAALDVVNPEPLPQDSPLWGMTNVLLTPHISGTVPQLRDKVFKIFNYNLKTLISSGQLASHQVDLTRGF
ncbi:phosphoglycerate dehydrogenase [Lacticaseibacillus paracasei]|nr:phosphoglycerate dehydrogenase [Lacticaseibacillus paracasei]